MTRPLSEETLSLTEAIRFFERYWVLIVGTALGAGLLTLVIFLFLLPPTYTATATLVVVPPRVSSDLTPPMLSVHGYRKILESPAVLVEVQERLDEAEVMPRGELLELGRNLETKIFISRREETTPLAPMIEAVARAEDGETAARMANTWAAVFLEKLQELTQRTTLADVRFIEEQYPETKGLLAEREQTWIELSSEYQKKLQEAETRGDRRIAALRKMSSEAVAKHRRESRQEIEGLLSSRLPDLGLAADDRLAGLLWQFAGVQVQLAQTSPLLNLEKAIADEALWVSLAVNSERDPELAEGLLTQEVNPVHNELSLQAIRLEEEIKGRAGGRLARVAALVADIERLQQERSASLSALEDTWSVELTALRRKIQFEVSGISRERQVRLDQLARERQQVAAMETEMAEKFNEAILAKARADIELIYLSTPAVTALDEDDRGVAIKTLLALALGAVFGCLVSIGRHVHVRT